MQESGPQGFSRGIGRPKARFLFSLGWGLLIGGITFFVGPVAMPSYNPIIQVAKAGLMILLLPGLIGGSAFSGNIHAFYLGPGALVNALVHFGISWFVFPRAARIKRNIKS
jgi:hypothetical protein